MTDLTERFQAALGFATELHRHQRRTGTSIPYVSHLLGVASIALEIGADEDQAIAALLHDAVEDQGGAACLKEIRHRFGDRVAGIGSDCADADVEPNPCRYPDLSIADEHDALTVPRSSNFKSFVQCSCVR